MSHNHSHSCTCNHENVKYCSHCSTVYCKDCNQEWSSKGTWNGWSGWYKPYTYPTTYPWYTYTSNLGTGANSNLTLQNNQLTNPTTASTLQSNPSCSHHQ